MWRIESERKSISILCVSHCSLTGWLRKRMGAISMPSRTTPEGGVAPATAAKVGKRSTVAAICEREGVRGRKACIITHRRKVPKEQTYSVPRALLSVHVVSHTPPVYVQVRSYSATRQWPAFSPLPPTWSPYHIAGDLHYHLEPLYTEMG